MTPRENLQNFFTGKPYEWIPTTNDTRRFLPEEICENVARAFVFQQEKCQLPYGGKDIFGIEWVFVPTVGGSMEVGHLTEDVEEWPDVMHFPDLDKDIDWEGAAKRNAEYLNTDKMLCTTIFTGLFERLIAVVGFENAALALIDEDQQESVHALFQKLTDLYIGMIERMHKYWNIGMIEFHDDWGNQRAAMFSPATHAEMIIPYIKQIVEAAHKIGVIVEMHSCGQIAALIPNLISTGIDTWRGQTTVIDKPALVAQYGDRFIFGVEIRPDGDVTDEELVQLAKDVKAGCGDKKVFYCMAKTLTPHQCEIVNSVING